MLPATLIAAEDALPSREAFVERMVVQHGFDAATVNAVMAQAQRKQSILDAISRPAERKPWHRYRPIFITQKRIDGGVEFLRTHRDVLVAAEQRFGVPPEIVTAIIGVETFYGRVTGSYRVLDALFTLGFHYPKRARFFAGELEQAMLLAREQELDLLAIEGSYAGAMGMPQFIPSSYRAYAVDFDLDGHTDLFSDLPDVVGSVANYLARHGWQPGEPWVTRVTEAGTDVDALIDKGLKPSLTTTDLNRAGLRVADQLRDHRVAIIDLEQAEGRDYYAVFNNFYAITRYNHSKLYAMAVVQLAQAIAKADRGT